jgi:hypothetical protein
MNLLQILRSAHQLSRLVLASFVLVVTVAAGSPVLHPRGLEMVCSSGGITKLVDADGSTASGIAQLDCPLCAAPGAPPPAPMGLRLRQTTLAKWAAPWQTSPVARLLGAALPARGPPRLV